MIFSFKYVLDFEIQNINLQEREWRFRQGLERIQRKNQREYKQHSFRPFGW